VDPEGFARALPRLFADYPRSRHPRDRRFAPILEDVGGLARENNLALLNLAASLLAPGESYVEVGSFKGLSLIAAMLGNAGDFVGVDDFSMGEGSRALLEANLRRHGLAGHTILEGDALRLLRAGALEGRRVGVYYYDAAHDYRSQLDALRLVEPHLVDGALMIVDDTDWPQVARALRDYRRRQPRARLLLELDGKDRGQPWWWEGVQVLAWGAPSSAGRGVSARVESERAAGPPRRRSSAARGEVVRPGSPLRATPGRRTAPGPLPGPSAGSGGGGGP
jgi:predicted O-methyltransferase YrrM